MSEKTAPPATAVINWDKTPGVCMDIYCPCGEHVHCDTYGDMGSAQFVRCPHCKQVLVMDGQVTLTRTAIDFDSKRGASAFIQWKGTEVSMSASCPCGRGFEIEGDFTYHADCPGCSAHYNCDPHVLVRLATAEEIGAAKVIQDPEKNLEDMTEEEQDAFYAAMQEQS